MESVDIKGSLINNPLDPTGDTVSTHGFLMAIELEPKTDLNRIVFDIMAACVKNKSIRDLDVEHMGEIEIVGDEEQQVLEQTQLDLPFDTGHKAN